MFFAKRVMLNIKNIPSHHLIYACAKTEQIKHSYIPSSKYVI
jgi:hypothetical protein